MGSGFLDPKEGPIVDKKTHADKGRDFQFAIASMQGWRAHMEDAHRIAIPFVDDEHFAEWSFFGIFDGHTSATIAACTAENIIEALKSTHFYKQLRHELEQCKNGHLTEEAKQTVAHMLKSGFVKLDEKMREKFAGEKSSGGCTALCAMVTPSHVFFANLGDSRGFYERGNDCVFTTREHKPTDLRERDRIEHAGGKVHNNRVEGALAMSRALGDYVYKSHAELPPTMQEVSPEPSVYAFERNRASENLLVLGCDGIFDVMENEDLCELIHTRLRARQDLTSILKDTLDVCLAKGSTDNMTLIVVVFDTAKNPQLPHTHKPQLWDDVLAS